MWGFNLPRHDAEVKSHLEPDQASGGAGKPARWKVCVSLELTRSSERDTCAPASRGTGCHSSRSWRLRQAKAGLSRREERWEATDLAKSDTPTGLEAPTAGQPFHGGSSPWLGHPSDLLWGSWSGRGHQRHDCSLITASVSWLGREERERNGVLLAVRRICSPAEEEVEAFGVGEQRDGAHGACWCGLR